MKKIIVFSPYKLNGEELNWLKNYFSFNNDVVWENIVKEDLIGGLIIKIDSKIINLSLKGILDNLKKKLLYET
ncbi:MAG: F0F1 ATP synthase subunit delta [Patescibacteria group bacterium]|nr:F0F1 ATP synthase subunit delta [Patescibacteria group bacterium]